MFRFAFLAAVVDLIMDQKHLYKTPFSFAEACFGYFVCLFVLLDKIPLFGGCFFPGYYPLEPLYCLGSASGTLTGL